MQTALTCSGALSTLRLLANNEPNASQLSRRGHEMLAGDGSKALPASQ